MGGCLEVKPEKGEMVMSMEPSVTIHTAITEDGNDGKDFYANYSKNPLNFTAESVLFPKS